MLDRNSHFAGLGSGRSALPRGSARNLPQVYRPHGQGSLPALYLSDGNARRLISRLKWFISTCIVGAIGLVIIGVSIYTTSNIDKDGSGIMFSLQRKLQEAMTPKTNNLIEEKAARPGEKSDKIKTTTKGIITKYTIQDTVVEKRNGREFLRKKPYTRIVASLSTVKPDNSNDIPPFNPFDLYSDSEPARDTSPQTRRPDNRSNNEFMLARFVEPSGQLPEEDVQELTDDEAERYVAEADAVYAESAAQLRPSIMPGNEGEMADASADNGAPAVQNNALVAANGERTRTLPHTTIAEKKTEEDEDTGDDSQVESIIVKPGDTLVSVLKGAGAEAWQAQAISDTINSKVPGGLKMRSGQEVRLKLIPAASDPSLKEPLKISVFTGTKHEATVERTSDGEYALSDTAVEVAKIPTAEEEEEDAAERASLYASVYSTGLRENLDQDVISRLLRVLSYDVDFKQKVRAGDGMELFFETKQEDDGTETAGELLYVAMTVGGEQLKYYRFRQPDGTIDFYNDKGSNSRKFLLQQPVKAGRFTSGFGFRRHPLLGIRKMHSGVDWAAPIGTPIVAAGNGNIEEAGRHGGNGNYVRIRHSNGYKTAYSHLSRIAPGLSPGAKVRQGQLIGYVGSTGFSTGPHLHYEVLINNRYTNPQKVRAPRSRQLASRAMQDFKKELTRIDELAHRTPFKTRTAAMSE